MKIICHFPTGGELYPFTISNCMHHFPTTATFQWCHGYKPPPGQTRSRHLALPWSPRLGPFQVPGDSAGWSYGDFIGLASENPSDLQGELQRGGAAILQEVLVVVEAGIRQETHLFRRFFLAGVGWTCKMWVKGTQRNKERTVHKGKIPQIKWLDVFLSTSQYVYILYYIILYYIIL